MNAVLAVLAVLAGGCNTFGADNEELTLTATASAQGVTQLHIAGVTYAPYGALSVSGGAAEIRGELDLTAWLSPDQNPAVLDEAFSLRFERTGSVVHTATRVSSELAETAVVGDARFLAPAELDVVVRDSFGGPVTVGGFVGSVSITTASKVTAHDIAGGLFIASDRTVDVTGGPIRVDVQGRDQVNAIIAGEGSVRSTDGGVSVEVLADDFDKLEVDAARGPVYVVLPAGAPGWSIDIVADGADGHPEAIQVKVGGVRFQEPSFDGGFEVGGGGPLIVIRGGPAVTVTDQPDSDNPP